MVNGMMPCRAGGAYKVCYRGRDDCRKWRWQRAKGGQKAGGEQSRDVQAVPGKDRLQEPENGRVSQGVAPERNQGAGNPCRLTGCQAPGLAQGRTGKL